LGCLVAGVAAALALGAYRRGVPVPVFFAGVGSIYLHVFGYGSSNLIAASGLLVLPFALTGRQQQLRGAVLIVVLLAVSFVSVGSDWTFALIWLGAAALAVVIASSGGSTQAIVSWALLLGAVQVVLGALDQGLLSGRLYNLLSGADAVPIAYGDFIRFHGLLPHPNSLGLMLAPIAAMGAVYVIASGERHLLRLGAVVIIWAGMVATLSRGAIAGALIAVCVTLVISPSSVISSRSRILVLGGFAASLVALLVVPLLNSVAASAFDPNYPSNVARAILRNGALIAISQSPWVGYGVAGMGHALAGLVPAGLYNIPSQLDSTDNLYLDLLLSFGVPATGLIIVVVGLAAARVRSTVRSIASLGAGCLAIAVAGLFDASPFSSPLLLVWVIFLGASLGANRRQPIQFMTTS
jgi:hypothetical protein